MNLVIFLKRLSMVLVILIGVVTIIGSSSTKGPKPPKPEYFCEPTSVENETFKASIMSLDCSSIGCKSFLLEIENKTENDLELDWNNTFYISPDNRTSGGFMFQGIMYKDRNNPKSPDIIFSKNNWTKIIYPSNLVTYFSRMDMWAHIRMEEGQHGVYLTVRNGSEVIKEKITTNIVKIEKDKNGKTNAVSTE